MGLFRSPSSPPHDLEPAFRDRGVRGPTRSGTLHASGRSRPVFRRCAPAQGVVFRTRAFRSRQSHPSGGTDPSPIHYRGRIGSTDPSSVVRACPHRDGSGMAAARVPVVRAAEPLGAAVPFSDPEVPARLLEISRHKCEISEAKRLLTAPSACNHAPLAATQQAVTAHDFGMMGDRTALSGDRTGSRR